MIIRYMMELFMHFFVFVFVFFWYLSKNSLARTDLLYRLVRIPHDSGPLAILAENKGLHRM